MTVVGHVLAVFLNILPILIVLGLLILFLRWLNRHISFNFDGTDSQGRVLVWVLRPVVLIGAGVFILALLSWLVVLLVAIL